MDIVHRGTHTDPQQSFFPYRADRYAEHPAARARAGVEIEFDKRIDDALSLSAADLIVASDGGNSDSQSIF
jgi:hypothetical protein